MGHLVLTISLNLMKSSEIRNAGDLSNRGLEIKLNEFFNINILQINLIGILCPKFISLSDILF